MYFPLKTKETNKHPDPLSASLFHEHYIECFVFCLFIRSINLFTYALSTHRTFCVLNQSIEHADNKEPNNKYIILKSLGNFIMHYFMYALLFIIVVHCIVCMYIGNSLHETYNY